MPIYEYICEICGKEVEITQKVGDPPPMCVHGTPDANSTSGYAGATVSYSMTKKISKTSFSLHGAGWARDNYGGKK
jgi:putative FmdB family regulatory protein